MSLTNYIVAAMVSWAPPSVHLYNHENNEFVMARYYSIANDLVDVVSEEEPLDLWNEPMEVRRAHTAVVLISIASFESGQFQRAVDEGKKKGDKGKSHCLMQVQLRDGETIESRHECFRIALSRVKESIAACPYAPIEEKLAPYAGGRCDVGRDASIRRMKRAEDWWLAAPYYGAIEEE